MLKHLARQTLQQVDALITPFFARHRILSVLYYSLLNPRFGREQLGVLRGRARYLRHRTEAPVALLRRNIHRLEKGLTMRPRSPIFARDYIEETVEAYARVSEDCDAHDPTRIWATHVLLEYFRIVDRAKEIDRAQHRFRALPSIESSVPDAVLSPQKIPRRRADSWQSSVTYEEFLSLCRQRRSVRWFQPRPVESALLEKAIAAALQAPSACNRQPFEFRLFLNPLEAQTVAALAMGTTGYAHQIPALIVIIGDLSCFEHERDRHVPYVDASLAGMQLMLALETLGLSSCPINWPDVEILERKMEAMLKLEPYQRPIMLIAIGFADPDGGVAHSEKKSVRQVVTDTSRAD